MTSCGMQGCVNGFIFDPYTRTRTACPECAKRREQEVVDGTVVKKLALPKGFTNTVFDKDLVISKQDKERATPSSYEFVTQAMQDLIDTVIRGEKPQNSVLFYFGRAAHAQNFINPLLVKGYLAGLVTTPAIDAATLSKLRLHYEDGDKHENMRILSEYTESEAVNYQDYMESDLCLVYMDAGATYIGINSAKGLCQLRAKRGLATILVTDGWTNSYYDMCIHDADYAGLYPLALRSIKYDNEDNRPFLEQMGVIPSSVHINRNDYSRMKAEQGL